jgi:UDP-2,4-diacetamido-2,4,6-trideoxy-beta-L-altropyranose hydrolase
MANMTVPEKRYRIAVQAAASAVIGGGHVVRSISLANALAAHNAACTFFVDEQTAHSVPLLGRSGHPIVTVSDDDYTVQSRASKDAPFDWVVIDDYSLSAADESPWRAVSHNILVIDDLANRQHDCDLLVDSTPSRRSKDYADRLPSGARLLLGPSYAPLRGEFAQCRPQALSKREMTEQPKHLLVSFGLTDPGGITAQAVSHIAAGLPDLAMNVVVGSQTASAATIQSLTRSNITIHSDPPSMSRLMINADIAIGAGGSTAWERACLGLPSVALILADNQRDIATGLEQAGALMAFENPQMEWAKIVASLGNLLEIQRWRKFSRAAANVCDGLGAERIVQAMLKLNATS